MSLVGFKGQNHEQQVGKRGPLDKVDDRRTPLSLWEPLNEEFHFNLDAAASGENKLCKAHWNTRVSGLENSWFAYNVWCNPPYSDIRPWVEKAHEEMRKYSKRVIVMLLPANRTEQSWWQDLIEPFRDRTDGCLETRFLRGRLRFDTPDTPYTDPRGNRPPFGCVLLIWRKPC